MIILIILLDKVRTDYENIEQVIALEFHVKFRFFNNGT